MSPRGRRSGGAAGARAASGASAAGQWRRERPLGRRVGRLGLVAAVVFGLLTAGAGYWQVLNASTLTSDPNDAANLAAERSAIRGTIFDRDGHVLASTKLTSTGDPYRVYADPAISHPIGYASRLFGSSGLEAADAGVLLGTGGSNPVDQLLAKFLPAKNLHQDVRTSLSLSLQKLAVNLLGSDRGAVVMLDPRSGDVLVLASTPVFDASAIANPKTSRAAFASAQSDSAKPLLDRAIQGKYVPGSVEKMVTALAGLQSGAISPSTTFADQPAAESAGLLVDGFRVRDGHHPFTGSTPLDFNTAVEVSCNIWFAEAGLKVGGGALDQMATALGFGSPLPFDLATATSQLTNGGGALPGGFADRVELANASYGQGEVLVTPLQMALVAATVANGGVEPRPRLVTATVSSDGSVHDQASGSMGRVVSPQVAAEVSAAMVRAVNGQWGREFTTGAALPNVTVAGKTGTAQLGGTGEPHSWFIGFAPAENPTIAIAVIVEKAGGGAVRAAPLAGQLLAAYFAAGGGQP